MNQSNRTEGNYQSVLGFGDVRGFYDFDSLSGQLPDSPKADRNTNLTNNLVMAHESNHWHQQLSTTYGNFTSILRWNILGLTSSIWRRLERQYKIDLINGVVKSPLNHEVTVVPKDMVLSNSKKTNRDFIEKGLRIIRGLKICDIALSTTSWIQSDKLKEQYHEAIVSSFDFLQQQNNVSDSVSENPVLYVKHPHVDSLSPNDGSEFFLSAQLWDVPLLLEASCVAQEFYAATGLTWRWRLASWRKERFETISDSSYSMPLKQVLHSLGYSWSQANLIKCSGLITSMVEVSLNPPIPPRHEIDSFEFSISEIHPSIRFFKIVKAIQGRKTKVKRFNKFAEIAYSDKKKSLSVYLDCCKYLSKLGDVSFDHRLEERYLYGKGTYFEATEALQVAFKTETKQERHAAYREFLSYYPQAPHYLLDSGYNRMFNGAYYLQNSVMIFPTLFERSSKYLEERGVSIDKNFQRYVAEGITSVPIEFSVGSYHKIRNTFIGEHTGLFVSEIHIHLALYLLLFHGESNISTSNISGIDTQMDKTETIFDILVNTI